MYPLLLEIFGEENNNLLKDPYDCLCHILKNLPKAKVKNGDVSGKTLRDAVRLFGKTALGENGMQTTVFKNNGGEVLLPKTALTAAESEVMIYPFGVVNNIVTSNDITADLLELNGKAGLFEKDSFMLICVNSGSGVVSNFAGTFRVKAGDVVFVPADFRIELMGAGSIVIAHF